jgi:hypothetical protein
MTTTSNQTSVIGPYDVLCGRGGATNNNIGNQNYRNIVASSMNEYLGARKKDKILIATKVVHEVYEKGGRFLRRWSESPENSIDVWVEIPESKAIAKTSQALRENLDVRNKLVRPHGTAALPTAATTTSSSMAIPVLSSLSNNESWTVPASFADGEESRNTKRKNRPRVVQGCVLLSTPTSAIELNADHSDRPTRINHIANMISEDQTHESESQYEEEEGSFSPSPSPPPQSWKRKMMERAKTEQKQLQQQQQQQGVRQIQQV